MAADESYVLGPDEGVEMVRPLWAVETGNINSRERLRMDARLWLGFSERHTALAVLVMLDKSNEVVVYEA
ncbi:hypothetical protein P170DRAFT_433535 [Aspergillus steynii IBT 23096]|uniref:Uncharacterized protein n=1 Tax=Aspergillus steynii IBT 23096 TaxID=1392250 RepID=A0A2I2GFJ9_9EURO|nr:uncharacterized protein P170DRAFT_433535 [Aspergillus steynii IBT 23096]PLB51656.1 hypothetical protein P170DRAFT_433535 [Aspergillus steynii IBT 23096]